MTSHRLVIELDAELLDSTWTEQDLLDNAVHFIEAAISRAEAAATGVSQPYRLDLSDLTVWTQAGYFDDHVADLSRDPSGD